MPRNHLQQRAGAVLTKRQMLIAVLVLLAGLSLHIGISQLGGDGGSANTITASVVNDLIRRIRPSWTNYPACHLGRAVRVAVPVLLAAAEAQLSTYVLAIVPRLRDQDTVLAVYIADFLQGLHSSSPGACEGTQ